MKTASEIKIVGLENKGAKVRLVNWVDKLFEMLIPGISGWTAAILTFFNMYEHLCIYLGWI